MTSESDLVFTRIVDDPSRGTASVILMHSASGEVMTVTLTFEDTAGGTRYTARVRRRPAVEVEVNPIGLELR